MKRMEKCVFHQKEVYDLYSAEAKMKPLSKKQLGTLVMNLCPTIKVIKNREGCHEYEGLGHSTISYRKLITLDF